MQEPGSDSGAGQRDHPDPLTDGELLARFAEHRDETAFQEVVARHLPWLHGAALRQLRDPGRAMDATQAVFILLSQKARAMDRSRPLAPWLFWALGYVVKSLRRSEARRSKHEAAAAGPAADDSSRGAAMELAEVLDGAVAQLRAADRQAILLRFYEERSLAEVAAAMRTTEEAAKKRVARAVETLRVRLSSRGYSGATLAGFAATLQMILHAPPATPAAATVAAGVLGASMHSSSFLLAKGATAMATAAKFKTVAALVLAAAVVTAGGFAVRSLQGQQSVAAPAGEAAVILRDPLLVATEPRVKVTQLPTHNARLSPDGRFLLYLSPQRVNGEVRDVLLMKNLRTQGFSVVPTDVSGGMDTVLTRFGMFLADGTLVVPQAQGGGAASAPGVPRRYELVSVNGETGVVKSMEVGGDGQVFAKAFKDGLVVFTMSREIFLALPPKYERQPVAIRGMVNAVSPGSDALVVLAPPERPMRVGPMAAPASAPRPAPTFVLYEVATGNKTVLPMHPRNTILDDCEAEFTADGRYLYYQDFRDGPEGKLAAITRVWDRTAGKSVAELDDMVPLGPGPAAGTMWLAESPGQGKGAVVHDAASGKMERFLAGKEVQHATGNRVAYLEKTDEGTWALNVVDVKAPAGK
jgi:RNA polymerase sigma factor (sigma-70 family)